MGVLSGLVFCMTGTLTETRSKITTLIEKHGGEVKGTVTNNVNILLATENEVASSTQKVNDAISKKVPIVNEDFIRDSISKKKQQDTDKYLLVKSTGKRSAPAKKSAAPKKKAKVAKKAKPAKSSAKWFWKGDKGWEEYATTMATKIEQQYLKYIKSGKKASTVNFGVDKERFIDFENMFQRRYDDTSKRREVKREYEDSDEEEDEEEEEGDDEELDIDGLKAKLMKTHLHRCLVPQLVDGESDVRSSKVGGLPYFKSGEEWPQCPNCSEARSPVYMNFFFQIDMATIPKEFQKLYGISSGLLQYFHCLEDTCGWEAFDNGSYIRVVPVKGPGESVEIPKTENKITPKRIKGWEVEDDLPMQEDADDVMGDDVADELVDEYHDKFPVSGDKMGGWPNWIQGTSFPDCEECGTKMTLLFQIESDSMIDFMWGDSGNCQLFQCPKHKTKFTTCASCC